MKVLIFGGNRFFGKKLVDLHRISGDHVTLINRNNYNSNYCDIQSDRDDFLQFYDMIKQTKWDAIYDLYCPNLKAAKNSIDFLTPITKKYIFISSQSVYDYGTNLKEKTFRPDRHEFSEEVTLKSNYSEAKRQLETIFYQQSNVIIVRPSIIFGEDDHTDRFNFHRESILEQSPIYFPNLHASLSLISSSEMAHALFSLSRSTYTGTINLATGDIKLIELLNIIEDFYNNKAILKNDPSMGTHSPYGVEHSWTMDTKLLTQFFPKRKNLKEEIKNCLIKLQSSFK